MKKLSLFWQAYLGLEKELIDVSKYIYFCDEVNVNEAGSVKSQSCSSQLSAFSPHIADLLVRCCVQIEAISKEIYFENGGAKQRGDTSLYFDEDCLKLVDQKWNVGGKKVLVIAPYFDFKKEENLTLKPLKNAHKRQGTYWERAYQAVKHDRFYSLPKGNVKALIHSLAALYLLNVYYRKDSWITKYTDVPKLDFSLGSSLFAVEKPVSSQLWYNNSPVQNESPFVMAYQEDFFQRIQKEQKEENDALTEYWRAQPELNEPEFISQLNNAIEQAKPDGRVMGIWELSKYRINKKCMASLPFNERLRRLLESEEWNCRIHQINHHLSKDEITEENIQTEIDMSGVHKGMEIQTRYVPNKWIHDAMNSEVCRIFIPD